MVFYQSRHRSFQYLGNLEMKLILHHISQRRLKVMGNASYKTKHRDFFFQGWMPCLHARLQLTYIFGARLDIFNIRCEILCVELIETLQYHAIEWHGFIQFVGPVLMFLTFCYLFWDKRTDGSQKAIGKRLSVCREQVVEWRCLCLYILYLYDSRACSPSCKLHVIR